jgi:hypothetical protein
MSPKSQIIAIVLAAVACAAMIPLPPIIGFGVFLLFAIVIRYHPNQSLPKRWLVYGALGGACLFFAGAFFVAYERREIPMALYGLPPDKWVRIAFHCSIPVGGFTGSVVGYMTALLIRGASDRAVVTGASIGCLVATVTTGIYAAWLTDSLHGRFIKNPSVIPVFCIVVLLLLLTVGGTLGAILGAVASRMRHSSH